MIFGALGDGFRKREKSPQPNAGQSGEKPSDNTEAFLEDAAGYVAIEAKTILDRGSDETIETIWGTEWIADLVDEALSDYGLPEAYRSVILEKAKKRLSAENTSH